MSRIPISVAISSLNLPFKQALQTAASLRVQGIEIDAHNDVRPSDMSVSGVRQLRKTLDDLNLKIKSVRFQTRRGYDCAEDLDRRIAATKDAMKMTVELRCNTLVNAIGNIGTDEDPTTNQTLREALTDIGRHSYHYGCFLASESGAESLSVLGNFIATLPEESIFIALNPMNLVAAGYGIEDLEECASKVRVAYIGDAVPDRARIGHITRVPLGQGVIDIPQIIGTLEDSRQSIPFVIDGRGQSNPSVACNQAVEFLNRM